MQLFSGCDSSNYSSRDAEWAIIFSWPRERLWENMVCIWRSEGIYGGHFICIWFIHMPFKIYQIPLSIDSTQEREYIWYHNTFRLYRHLIRKHRWFSIAMKNRISQALYLLFWWFLKSTFNNLWRYSHIIFFRERIPQYRYTRRSVFLQIPITFIYNFLICPIPAFNLISVYHYSQHWANFVSNNTGIAEYIKIQALKVSCFQFVSNWDFWCEGSH